MLDSDMETWMRVILLYVGFTGIILSAAEEVKSLTGVVGGNIIFPDSLKESGFLLRDRKIIAMVIEKKLKILKEIYTDKLHWNKKNGKFTIKNLQRNDSGIYDFDSENENVFKSLYNLTVYDSAPSPAVRRLNVGSDSCLLECWVDKKTKLSWYKDGKILNQSSSDLSLILTVDKQDFNYSYQCVSANPAESKTHPVNISSFCSEENKAVGQDAKQRHYWIIVITVLIVILTVFMLGVALTVWRMKQKIFGQEMIKQKQDCVNRQTETLFTAVQEGGDGLGQAGIFPASSGSADTSCLTTVCYKPALAHG